jgi:hypothetical protein
MKLATERCAFLFIGVNAITPQEAAGPLNGWFRLFRLFRIRLDIVRLVTLLASRLFGGFG